MNAQDVARRDEIDNLMAELRVERREIERRLHVARVAAIVQRQKEDAEALAPEQARRRARQRLKALGNPVPFNERAERDTQEGAA